MRRRAREVRDVVHRPAETAAYHSRARPVEMPLTPNVSSFFGYYTRSPWNAKGDILFQETRGRRARASRQHRLTLKVYGASSKAPVTVGQTKAWNWQQGCMAQWLGAAGDKLIYNDYSDREDAYFSKIVSLYNGAVRPIARPIYSVDPEGSFALTLNFSRLARLRPDYGYFNKNTFENLDVAHDGIWRVDLLENEARLIFTLEEIIAFQHSDNMNNVEHKVNHLDVSPDGRRFLFLHRWFPRGGKVTRLLTADTRGGDLHCLANDGIVTHCTWKNERQVLAWASKAGVGERYFLFTDQSEDYEVIGEDCLEEDGHPSFSPDGQWLLTDTYPDARGMSRLVLFDLRRRARVILAALYQPFRFYGERRCDLHPRWSLDGDFVSFDSCHSGKRRFYVLDVREIVRLPGIRRQRPGVL